MAEKGPQVWQSQLHIITNCHMLTFAQAFGDHQIHIVLWPLRQNTGWASFHSVDHFQKSFAQPLPAKFSHHNVGAMNNRDVNMKERNFVQSKRGSNIW